MELIFSTANTELFEIGEEAIEKWKQENPKDEILMALDHPVVAFSGATPVGLFEVSVDYFASVMWLDSLWVDPDLRLRGHGTEMFKYIIKTCQYQTLKLYSANHSNSFYLRNGMKHSVGNYYEKSIND